MNASTIDTISVRQPSSRCILDSFCVEEISEHIHCEQRGAGKGCPDNQKRFCASMRWGFNSILRPSLTISLSSW